MSKLLNEDLATLLNRLFELSRESDCTVRTENSPKGYTAYHIDYDFGVDKFSSFIILHHEGNSTGAESDDYGGILQELEDIVGKAQRIKL